MMEKTKCDRIESDSVAGCSLSLSLSLPLCVCVCVCCFWAYSRYWFHYFCRVGGIAESALPAEFRRVAEQYALDIRGPFEQQTRELVGLQENWYQQQ